MQRGLAYRQPVIPQMQGLLSEAEIARLPYRVLPGGLSVSRTIGDIGAKHPNVGGNPNVIVAIPEISYFKVSKCNDFLVLGCDGIYDSLNNSEIVAVVWETAKREYKKGLSIHKVCGVCAEEVLKLAMRKDSLDNVSAVVVAFENFERQLKKDVQSEVVQTKIADADGIFAFSIYRHKRQEQVPIERVPNKEQVENWQLAREGL